MERKAMSRTLTDNSDKVIKAIRAGGRERELALKGLYENSGIFRAIAKTVTDFGGFEPDVHNIFQRSIIVFDRMVRSGKFKKESSLDTYIVGIGRNLCRNWVRVRSRDDVIPEEDIWPRVSETYSVEDDWANDNELQEVLEGLLEQIKPICRSILRMWQLSYTMQEITEQLDLGTPANARKRKHRCLKYLIDEIRQSPDLEQYLKEAWRTAI